MDDGEVVVIRPDGLTFLGRDGETLRQDRRCAIPWDPIMAEKGGYKHFMLKEIHEQPRAVRDTLLGRVSLESSQILLDEIGLSDDDLRVGDADVDRGLRHLVARRARREVPHRAARAASRSRSTTRPSSATGGRSSTSARWPCSSASPARRPTRSPRCARRRPAGAKPLGICNVRGSMLTREARRHDLHARGTRDRRRLDQGVHEPARRAHAPGVEARARARERSARTSCARSSRDLYHIPAQMEQYLADDSAIERAGPAGSSTTATSCTSAAA